MGLKRNDAIICNLCLLYYNGGEVDTVFVYNLQLIITTIDNVTNLATLNIIYHQNPEECILICKIKHTTYIYICLLYIYI